MFTWSNCLKEFLNKKVLKETQNGLVDWLANYIINKNENKAAISQNAGTVIHYLKNKVGIVDFANAQGLVMF